MGQVSGKLSNKQGKQSSTKTESVVAEGSKTRTNPEKNDFIEGEFPLVDVPDDVLFEVLKWVPVGDIVKSCVYVCRQWKRVIDTQMFWKEKCIQELGFPNEMFRFLIDEDFKLLYFKRPYQYNLIQNPDGSDELKHWTIHDNGGNRWKAETPVGCEPVEEFTGIKKAGKVTPCWVSSYHTCSKSQTINLIERGCSPLILDEVRPNIRVSEWYAARFDCGINYKITVQLLKEVNDREPVTEWTFEDTKPAGREWFKAEHTFSSYEPGVRFVRYYHEGSDTQFWAGWYGAKITLSSVVLDLTHTAGDSSAETS